MKISSNRQFRNYVISWFLVIAGLIISVGGYFIYQSVELYLYSSYKQEKKTLVQSLASLLDGKNFQRITKNRAKSQSASKALNNQLLNVAGLDNYNNHIFSVAINSEDQRLVYVTDTNKASHDLILVSSDIFEWVIALDPSGKPRFLENHQFSNRKSLVLNGKNLIAELSFVDSNYVLNLAGNELLRLEKEQPLKGTAKAKRIDINNRDIRTVDYSLNGINKKVFINFVAKGEVLHGLGTNFYAEPGLVNVLRRALSNSAGVNEFSITKEDKSEKYIYAPIKSGERTVGLLIMHINNLTQQKLQEGLLKPVIFGLSILTICWMFAAILFSRKITNPLDELTVAIARLVQNDFNFKLSPKKFGSFGFLANQFNTMLMRLHKSRTELIHLNKSYSRFVPHQLLKQLSAGGVKDIALGDCCERKMTVLFCDIRGFTSLSERMSPEANFKFINRYLNQIAPVINKHGGIIDKYLGDGIMALFPNGADDALQASIDMLSSLEKYNQKLRQNKLPTIEVGLGLQTGKTMLGTVGTSARMDATVISDTVNAAARVESMTKAFATKILITDETKKDLKDLSKYRIRYIAACHIQGKAKPVTLYEVFNNDSLSLQREKQQNQSVMIQAWKAYKDGDSARAIQLYQRQIEKSPHDKSLFALIERCQSGRL